MFANLFLEHETRGFSVALYDNGNCSAFFPDILFGSVYEYAVMH